MLRTVASVGLGLALVGSVAGCKKSDPLYCDENTPCSAGHEACDLNAACTELRNTCLPPEDVCWDAAVGGVDAGRQCEDGADCQEIDPQLTFCSTEGTCLQCEPDAFIRCEADDVVTCNSSGTGESANACDLGCNTGAGRCNECTPSTSACVDAHVVVCDGNGAIVMEGDCLLGCHASGSRCNDLDPSNALATYLDSADTGPTVTLGAGSTINTGNGVVTGTDATIPTALLTAPSNGAQIRVLMVKSLTITGDVNVSGTPALAIVSDGDIIMTAGRFNLSGRNGVSGPGALNEAAPCGEGGTYAASLPRPGHGGGGYGTAGGAGGRAVNYGAQAGLVNGVAELIPLRGGCRGGGLGENAEGSAGGAIQLVSRTRVSLSGWAYIDVTGAAGRFRPSSGGGGGGGSGGGVLIEAPIVQIASESGITANGGGGGCKGHVGTDGAFSVTPAAGAYCSPTLDGEGGQGGARDGTAESGTGADTYDTGGGGGGAAGRIRINAVTFTNPSGTIISPAASLGAPAIR